MTLKKRINLYAEIFEGERLYIEDLITWSKYFKKAIMEYEHFTIKKRIRFSESVFKYLDQILDLHTCLFYQLSDANEKCRLKYIRSKCEELGLSYEKILCYNTLPVYFQYRGTQSVYSNLNSKIDDYIFTHREVSIFENRNNKNLIKDDELQNVYFDERKERVLDPFKHESDQFFDAHDKKTLDILLILRKKREKGLIKNLDLMKDEEWSRFCRNIALLKNENNEGYSVKKNEGLDRKRINHDSESNQKHDEPKKSDNQYFQPKNHKRDAQDPLELRNPQEGPGDPIQTDKHRNSVTNSTKLKNSTDSIKSNFLIGEKPLNKLKDQRIDFDNQNSIIEVEENYGFCYGPEIDEKIKKLSIDVYNEEELRSLCVVKSESEIPSRYEKDRINTREILAEKNQIAKIYEKIIARNEKSNVSNLATVNKYEYNIVTLSTSKSENCIAEGQQHHFDNTINDTKKYRKKYMARSDYNGRDAHVSSSKKSLQSELEVLNRPTSNLEKNLKENGSILNHRDRTNINHELRSTRSENSNQKITPKHREIPSQFGVYNDSGSFNYEDMTKHQFNTNLYEMKNQFGINYNKQNEPKTSKTDECESQDYEKINASCGNHQHQIGVQANSVAQEELFKGNKVSMNSKMSHDNPRISFESTIQVNSNNHEADSTGKCKRNPKLKKKTNFENVSEENSTGFDENFEQGDLSEKNTHFKKTNIVSYQSSYEAKQRTKLLESGETSFQKNCQEIGTKLNCDEGHNKVEKAGTAIRKNCLKNDILKSPNSTSRHENDTLHPKNNNFNDKNNISTNQNESIAPVGVIESADCNQYPKNQESNAKQNHPPKSPSYREFQFSKPRYFLYGFDFSKDDPYQDHAANIISEYEIYEDLCYERIFLNNLSLFHIYQLYAYELPKIEFLIKYEIVRDKRFFKYMNDFLQSRNHALGHMHFIYRPTQKLTRYPLLFASMKKYTDERTKHIVEYLFNFFMNETRKMDEKMATASEEFDIYKMFLYTRYSATFDRPVSLCLFMKNRRIVREIQDVLVRSRIHLEPKSFTLVIMDHCMFIADYMCDGLLKKYCVRDNPVPLCKVEILKNGPVFDKYYFFLQSQFSFRVKAIDRDDTWYFYCENEAKSKDLENALRFAINLSKQTIDPRFRLEKVWSTQEKISEIFLGRKGFYGQGYTLKYYDSFLDYQYKSLKESERSKYMDYRKHFGPRGCHLSLGDNLGHDPILLSKNNFVDGMIDRSDNRWATRFTRERRAESILGLKNQKKHQECNSFKCHEDTVGKETHPQNEGCNSCKDPRKKNAMELDVQNKGCNSCKDPRKINAMELDVQNKGCNSCKDPRKINAMELDVQNEGCNFCKDPRKINAMELDVQNEGCNFCKDPRKINDEESQLEDFESGLDLRNGLREIKKYKKDSAQQNALNHKEYSRGIANPENTNLHTNPFNFFYTDFKPPMNHLKHHKSCQEGFNLNKDSDLKENCLSESESLTKQNQNHKKTLFSCIKCQKKQNHDTIEEIIQKQDFQGTDGNISSHPIVYKSHSESVFKCNKNAHKVLKSENFERKKSSFTKMFRKGLEIFKKHKSKDQETQARIDISGSCKEIDGESITNVNNVHGKVQYTEKEETSRVSKSAEMNENRNVTSRNEKECISSCNAEISKNLIFENVIDTGLTKSHNDNELSEFTGNEEPGSRCINSSDIYESDVPLKAKYGGTGEVVQNESYGINFADVYKNKILSEPKYSTTKSTQNVNYPSELAHNFEKSPSIPINSTSNKSIKNLSLSSLKNTINLQPPINIAKSDQISPSTEISRNTRSYSENREFKMIDRPESYYKWRKYFDVLTGNKQKDFVYYEDEDFERNHDCNFGDDRSVCVKDMVNLYNGIFLKRDCCSKFDCVRKQKKNFNECRLKNDDIYRCDSMDNRFDKSPVRGECIKKCKFNVKDSKRCELMDNGFNKNTVESERPKGCESCDRNIIETAVRDSFNTSHKFDSGEYYDHIEKSDIFIREKANSAPRIIDPVDFNRQDVQGTNPITSFDSTTNRIISTRSRAGQHLLGKTVPKSNRNRVKIPRNYYLDPKDNVYTLNSRDFESKTLLDMHEADIQFKIRNYETISTTKNRFKLEETDIIFYVNDGLYMETRKFTRLIYKKPVQNIVYLQPDNQIFFLDQFNLKTAPLTLQTQRLVPFLVKKNVSHFWYTKSRQSEYFVLLRKTLSAATRITVLKRNKKCDFTSFEIVTELYFGSDINQLYVLENNLLVCSREILIVNLELNVIKTFLNPFDAVFSVITLDNRDIDILDLVMLNDDRYFVCTSTIAYSVNRRGSVDDRSVFVPLFDEPKDFRAFGDVFVVLSETALFVYNGNTGELLRSLFVKGLRFLSSHSLPLVYDEQNLYEIVLP